MPSEPPRKLSEEEIKKLRELVMERAKHMSEDDLKALLANESVVETKAAALTKKLPNLVRHVKVGFSMVKDYARGDYRKIPWWSIASVGAALGYFLMPADAVPDFIPLLGYLDDATVFAAVMTGIREDLKRYCDAKGIKLEE